MFGQTENCYHWTVLCQCAPWSFTDGREIFQRHV